MNQDQWLSIRSGALDAEVYVRLIEKGEVVQMQDGSSSGLWEMLQDEPTFPTDKLEEIRRLLGPDGPDGPDEEIIIGGPGPNRPPPDQDGKPLPPSPCAKINALEDWPDFEDALDDASISDKDWHDCLGIPAERIAQIRAFINQEANLDWDDIATQSTQEITETGTSTDVYFIGATSAGKSCILAALTNRLKDSGDMLINTDASLPGMQYTNYLSLCRDVKCLPDATGSGVAFATSFDVYHDKNSGDSKHSWNFVEMAGERVFQLQRSGNIDEINVNGWMNTGNAKIINFVVDPTFDASARGIMQDSLMNQAFAALKNEGVFEKTTLVNIVVNKFDLQSEVKDNWQKEAREFVEQKFSPLVNSLKNIQYKKGFFGSKKLFELHVIPFSIGDDFSYSRYVHNWDWTTTEQLINVLKRNTPHR